MVRSTKSSEQINRSHPLYVLHTHMIESRDGKQTKEQILREAIQQVHRPKNSSSSESSQEKVDHEERNPN